MIENANNQTRTTETEINRVMQNLKEMRGGLVSCLEFIEKVEMKHKKENKTQ